jgi:hypothetical protein
MDNHTGQVNLLMYVDNKKSARDALRAMAPYFDNPADVKAKFYNGSGKSVLVWH